VAQVAFGAALACIAVSEGINLKSAETWQDEQFAMGETGIWLAGKPAAANTG
jgi:hypothetical protein